MILSASRWQQLMKQWLLPVSLDMFEQLQQLYAEPHRAYHTANHIQACLQLLDDVRSDCCQPDIIEMAIWFHDAIYDPKRQDNEAASAQLATTFLAPASAAKSSKVAQAILLTAKHQATDDPDMAYLLDIDLSILGADSASFETYEQAIRREYQQVPIAFYRQKRGEVLQHFLAKERLFLTDYFHQSYAEQARKNLQWAVSNLPSVT